MTPFENGVYCGLSEINLIPESFDLGEGITISKTYAHLMNSYVMAFAPAPPGEHHPAPWKSARGGSAFDIQAELYVPVLKSDTWEHINVAQTINFLLKIGVNPAISLSVFSNYAFSRIPSLLDSEEVWLFPHEARTKHFVLGIEDGDAKESNLGWVKQHWRRTHNLLGNHAELRLAADAIRAGQFNENKALTLVSLWGALEALFLKEKSELRFRVSALIASYLKPPGKARHQFQKEVAKLYDKRSSAAHGRPSDEEEALLKTFNILREVIIEIVHAGALPSKESLEALLFGDTESH